MGYIRRYIILSVRSVVHNVEFNVGKVYNFQKIKKKNEGCNPPNLTAFPVPVLVFILASFTWVFLVYAVLVIAVSLVIVWGYNKDFLWTPITIIPGPAMIIAWVNLPDPVIIPVSCVRPPTFTIRVLLARVIAFLFDMVKSITQLAGPLWGC